MFELAGGLRRLLLVSLEAGDERVEEASDKGRLWVSRLGHCGVSGIKRVALHGHVLHVYIVTS